MSAPDTSAVREYLIALQQHICLALEEADGEAHFKADDWQRAEGGGGQSRVLTAGRVFEQAGVNFSHIRGDHLPASASAQRPELAGCRFEALGVSLVIHPLNPYVPTSHANVRFFCASRADAAPVWWFGGGFDLTPFYGFEQDAVHWHRVASDLCQPFGKEVYPAYKKWCDEYFMVSASIPQPSNCCCPLTVNHSDSKARSVSTGRSTPIQH